MMRMKLRESGTNSTDEEGSEKAGPKRWLQEESKKEERATGRSRDDGGGGDNDVSASFAE